MARNVCNPSELFLQPAITFLAITVLHLAACFATELQSSYSTIFQFHGAVKIYQVWRLKNDRYIFVHAVMWPIEMFQNANRMWKACSPCCLETPKATSKHQIHVIVIIQPFACLIQLKRASWQTKLTNTDKLLLWADIFDTIQSKAIPLRCFVSYLPVSCDGRSVAQKKKKNYNRVPFSFCKLNLTFNL